MQAVALALFLLLPLFSPAIAQTGPACLPVTDAAVDSLRGAMPLCDQEFAIAQRQSITLFLREVPLTDATLATLASLTSVLRALGHGPRVSSVTKSCLNALIRLTCSQVIRVCNDTYQLTVLGVPTQALPLPSAPCRSSCQALYDSGCDAAIRDTITALDLTAVLATLLPNCTAEEQSNPSVLGEPRFPDDLTEALPVQWWNVTVAGEAKVLPAVCQDLREAEFLQTPSSFPCYGPWTSVSNDQGYCDLECPIPTFPTAELRRAATLSLVLGWVGYVLTLVVFCVMVFSKRSIYRSYPAMLVPMVLAGAHIVSFGFILSCSGNWRWTLCTSSHTPSSNSRPVCVFAGLVILFGALVTTFLWTLIAVNAATAFVLNGEAWLQKRIVRYVSLGVVTVLPAILSIIALAVNAIGPQPGLVFCFVADSTVDDSPYYQRFTWQYPLFIGPMCICILIVTVCMVAVIVRLLLAGVAERQLEKFMRVGAYLLVYLAIDCMIVSFRYVRTVNQNSWVDSFQAYSRASISDPDAPYTGNKPSKGLFYAFAVITSAQGVLTAVLFGSNFDVLKMAFGATLSSMRSSKEASQKNVNVLSHRMSSFDNL